MVVQTVADDVREQSRGGGPALDLVVETGPGGDAVVGFWDRTRLEQVVTNLLSNALKFGAGKPIRVRVERPGRDGRFDGRDQGVGIAPADQKRIFGRFERAVSVRHYGGLGLGLFIVRQIVDSLGGCITVRSSPGKGRHSRWRCLSSRSLQTAPSPKVSGSARPGEQVD